MSPRLVPTYAGDVPALLAALRAALDGGPALLPYADTPLPLLGHLPDGAFPDGDLPDGLALAVATSGSTGSPKLSLLTASALRASAAATHAVLGGPGRWLLALTAAHIAGIQVLVRSVIADLAPVLLDRSGPFEAGAFARAAGALGEGPAYTALVPTQVARLLADPTGTAALARFDAVLVGGAATPPSLRTRAADAGVRLVATYGMSETAGGCVYDGQPLPGTRIALDADGRVRLGGPTLASGYLGRPDESAAAFVESHGQRWFVTDDLGEIARDGSLRILGRLDDVIVTGGLKVHPRVVEEAALAHLPGVTDAVAVGVPDPEWGQAIVLAVTGTSARVTTAEVRERLGGELAAYALPKRVLVLDALPERGPGKPDRAAVAARAIREAVGEWGA